MIGKMCLVMVILFMMMKMTQADMAMYAACQAACATGCATTGPGFPACYAACQQTCAPLLAVPGQTCPLYGSGCKCKGRYEYGHV